VKSYLLGLFARDVRRKLLALFFALVLFDVLDMKVQAVDRFTVEVHYVDAPHLDVPDTPDRASRLLVVERAPGAKLLVAARPRPDRVTFRIHATRDLIERAKSRRHDFVFRLAKEGLVEPVAADLEGVAALEQELGPGARLELEPVQFLVESEETTLLVLARDDFVLRGSPPPGYDRRRNTLVFRPTEVRFVGPRSVLQRALGRDRSQLFEAIELDGTSSEVTQGVGLRLEWQRDLLRMLDAAGEDLPAVRVSVRFERRMVPVAGSDGEFTLPVQVVPPNDEVLRAKDPQKSWRDGWRLELPKARDGELKLSLRILAPETFTTAPVLDRAKLAVAKDRVYLAVHPEDAAGVIDRTTLPVEIVKRADFPPDLDVVFADGRPTAEVEVRWVPPAPAPQPPAESKEKGGAHDGD
jgi:hypothetical protein